MRKIQLFFVMLTFPAMLSALTNPYRRADGERKNTIELSGKGFANSTFLFNNLISDAGNEQDYAAGWGFSYGVGFSMYFGKIGFGIEGLMGNHRGAYAGSIVNATGQPYEYSSNVNLKITQIPVFFKLKGETGGYLEIGPQYNIINEATYHYTSDGVQFDSVMTPHYASNYISAVLGAGFKIPIAKSRIAISAGLRLQYSLTDLQGVDALGVRFIDPFKYPEGPQSTSAATAGFMLGVTYTIGEKKKEEKK